MMFHIVYLICALNSISCGSTQMPDTYATAELCKAKGSENAMANLMPKPGDGGTRIASFICLKS